MDWFFKVDAAKLEFLFLLGVPTLKLFTNLIREHKLEGKGSFTLTAADSAVDCVNAEIGIFQSLWHNANVHCRIHTSVNEP